MNNKALKTLEYTKIIEMLAAHASSPLGKIRCEDLLPSCSPGEIEYKQEQTQDALSRLFQKGNINFGSAKDIRGSLKRLEIGSTLGITELLQICALLDNTSRVKSYGRREKETAQRDSLDDLFDALEPLPLLNTEIRRCILSEDEIADDASAALKQIRRSMKVTGEHPYTACRYGQRFRQNLSAGCRDHHAKRTLLYPGQSRIQRTGSGYDPRPVLHRFHSFYRTDGNRKTEQ